MALGTGTALSRRLTFMVEFAARPAGRQIYAATKFCSPSGFPALKEIAADKKRLRILSTLQVRAEFSGRAVTQCVK
jgi:hypothetical protein